METNNKQPDVAAQAQQAALIVKEACERGLECGAYDRDFDFVTQVGQARHLMVGVAQEFAKQLKEIADLTQKLKDKDKQITALSDAKLKLEQELGVKKPSKN